jgi:glycosyltransferase involved in cell wall biosynthesis
MDNSAQTWPKISVVLPIRNEARFIGRTIRYLQEQDYPIDKLEILAVVGDSDDNTVPIVQQIAAGDERVKYLHNPKKWSSSARNVGAKAATGEIITYVDGHTYIDNNQLLKNTARLMAENDVAVLSRPQFLDTPDNSPFQRAVALARRSALGHGLDSTIYSDQDMFVNPASAGASYKRKVFEKVGYFDESFDASEDYEFNHRVAQAGYRAFTSLKLAVYYYPRDSLGALFSQMVRYGIGRMRLARKHPATLGLGTLVPPLFTAGLVVLPLLSLVLPWLVHLFALLYGLYLLAVLVTSFTVAAHISAAYFFLLPPIYLCIHLGLGYGFLRELIVGWKPNREEKSL